MESYTFMGACKHFFGLLPNQTALQFGAEIKKLSPEDRTEIAAGLAALGYDIQSKTV